MNGATRRILGVLLEDPEAEQDGLTIARLGRVRAWSLYPALDDLETAGWVTARWVEGETPRRRVYRLTAQGIGLARLALAP